jgi:hypothetical protein
VRTPASTPFTVKFSPYKEIGSLRSVRYRWAVPGEPNDNLRFEIGHVLFIDIVGYSKLLIEEQKGTGTLRAGDCGSAAQASRTYGADGH